MQKRRVFWIFLAVLVCLGPSLAAQDRKNPFSAQWDDSIQTLNPGTNYILKVKFNVPKGHYLYKDKTDVSLSTLADLTELRKIFPPAKLKMDPFLKKEVEIYQKDFEVELQLKVPSSIPLGRRTLEGEVRYQGCSSEFCYRLVKTPLLVPLNIATSLNKALSSGVSDRSSGLDSSAGFWSLLKEGKIEALFRINSFFPILIALIAGILTSLTPCVLPIIPLTLAVVGVEKQRSVRHNLAVSFFLVLGITVTYTALGLASAFLGLRLGFLFQSRFFLSFLIVFFIIMSLAMLGLIRLELPLRFRNFLGKVGGSGFRGAFLAGLTIGFIASPCVGPLVGPLLIWVAQSQNILWGAGLLMVYGLGMGLLFLVTGTFFSTLGARVRGGGYTNTIKKVLAVLIFLPALYYGYVLAHPLFKSVSHGEWVHSLQEGLNQAKAMGKPVLIDFYADWCLPCLELDQKTFSNPQVKEVLKEFVRIKIDCTLDNPHCDEAVNRFEVIGWPTVLFLDKFQRLQKDLSVIGGFVGPEKMEQLLSEVKKRG